MSDTAASSPPPAASALATGGIGTYDAIVYAGGAPKYRDRCDEVSAAGYVGFTFV